MATTQNVINHIDVHAVSAGTNSVTNGTVYFSNANGISFGMDTNGSITGTVQTNYLTAQSNQTIGAYAVGNTTQNSSSTFDARTVSFNGLGAATVGFSNGSIDISVPVQTVESQSAGISNLGNTSGTSGIASGAQVRFLLAGGNNVTLSQSVNGASATVTISAFNQSNQNISFFGLGNTTQNSSTVLGANVVSLNGLGAATVGFSNGSIQLSVPTQTVESQSIGMSNIGNTSGTTGIASGGQVRYLFAGGNNITLSQSINGASGTITISAFNQSNQDISFFALGNTTQNSSSHLGANVVSLNGLGAISIGFSNGSIDLSVPTQTAESNTIGISNLGNTSGTSGVVSGNQVRYLLAGGNNITLSQSVNGSSATVTISAANQTNQNISFFGLGNTTQNSSTNLGAAAVSFNGLGIVTVGFSNGSIQLSATQSNQNISLYALGNTTQNSSTLLNASNLSFNGLGNVTVGYSNGSIQISGGTAAADGINVVSASGNTSGTLTTFSTGTIVLAGGNNITLSQSSNTITISAGGAVALTLSQYYYPPFVVLTSNQGATNAISQSLQYLQVDQNVSFSQLGILYSCSGSTRASTDVQTIKVSIGATIFTNNAGTLSSSISGSQSYSNSWSSNATSSCNGIRMLTVPIATLLTPGEYWVAVSNNQATTGGFGFTNQLIVQSMNLSQGLANWGNATAVANGFPQGMGGVNTSLSQTINLTAIQHQQSAAWGDMLLRFANVTYW